MQDNNNKLLQQEESYKVCKILEYFNILLQNDAKKYLEREFNQIYSLPVVYGFVQEHEYTNKTTKQLVETKKLNIEINFYNMFLRVHKDLIQMHIEQKKYNSL